MRNSIDCYEIDRYEVHVFKDDTTQSWHTTFDTEDEAIEFATEFIQDHPGFKFKLCKIYHAILSQG